MGPAKAERGHIPDQVRLVSIRIGVGDLALAGLRAQPRSDVAGLSQRVSAAMRSYLDAPRSRGGWRYPGFGETGRPSRETAISLELPVDLWEEFVAEAEAQDVDPERLVSHAVLFYVAGLDARDGPGGPA